MHVLIIGGTSFCGPHVVRKLVALGHKVTVFHRNKTTAELPHAVNHLYGDRRHLQNHAAKFSKLAPDILIDMIPITEQDAVTVMKIFTGIAKRIVGISSQDVYRAYGIMTGIEHGAPDPVPLAEDAPLRSRLYPYRGEKPRPADDPIRYLDDYDKILVEKAYMGDPGLPGTIIRLPMVYGPHDRQHRLFDHLKRMDDKRPVIILSENLSTWRWTRGYVEDMATAIVLAATNDASKNRIYNAGETESLTMAEWVKRIAKVTGWIGDLAIIPEDRLPDEFKSGMNTAQDLVTDTSRIRDELGYQETLTVDESLKRTIEWERANPPDNVDPKRFDYEKEDKIFKSLK